MTVTSSQRRSNGSAVLDSSMEVLGSQLPRIWTPRDERFDTLGPLMEAISQLAGITLDEWQTLIGDIALEVNSIGEFVHRLVLFVVGRQNGKSVVLKARILLGLFGLEERLILHTAQDRALPREIFEELCAHIGDTPAFHRRLAHKGIRDTNGQERIRLKSGARYMIKAPRAARFRGQPANLIIIDEIREQHNRDLVGAALPAQSAVRNPQMWLTSNAGDLKAVELAAQQQRGRAAAELPGSDPDIAYLEWSAGDDRDPADPHAWAEANPALGRRITVETIAAELRTMSSEAFETERMCRTLIALTSPAIPIAKWNLCGGEPAEIDPDELPRPQAAIHIDGERTAASLVLAVKRDGRLIVDLVAEWVDEEGIDLEHVASEVIEWLKAHRVRELAYDRRRSAVIADRVADLGYEVHRIDATEFVISSQILFDAVTTGQLLHRHNPELDRQIAATGRRTGIDGTWYVSEPASSGNITGVVALAFACNLAYGADTTEGGFRWMRS